MDFKSEKMTYTIAIILFIVGVACYSISGTTTEEPIRIMFPGGNGGNVLFDHVAHSSQDAYGYECSDCHHYFEEDAQDNPDSCLECHELDSEDEDMPKRSDAFHAQCIGCHEDDGTAPTVCADCHIM